jgi:hypothetical protein
MISGAPAWCTLRRTEFYRSFPNCRSVRAASSRTAGSESAVAF